MIAGNKYILFGIIHKIILITIVLLGFITIVASGGGGGGAGGAGGGGEETVNDTPSVEDEVSDPVSPDDNNDDINIPLPPANLAAVPSNSKIEITWEESSDSSGYNLYYSELPDVNKLNGNKIEDVQSPYTHSPLLNGTTVYYTITAYNDDGESSESIEASAQPFNTEPTAIIITPEAVISDKQFQVDASSSYDADGTIASYKLDFGDGSPIISQSEPIFNHVYQNNDKFILVLTVEDNEGATDTITSYIESGALFSSPVSISNSLDTYSQSPEIHIDELGNAYVMWQERGSEVRLAISNDQGSTFSEPKIVFPWDGSPVHSFNITNNGDYLHTAWTYLQTNGDTEILYSRSTDRGQSFEPPAFLSVVDGINSLIGGMASDGNNYLCAVMKNAEPGTTVNNISFTFSEDNGETFSYPAIISDFGAAPDVAIYGQYVFITWFEYNYTNTGVYFSRSEDFGRTFTDPVNICPACSRPWTPVVKVSNTGNIYIVWLDELPDSDLRNVMISKSVDHGLNFDTYTALPNMNIYQSKIGVFLDDEENIYLSFPGRDEPESQDVVLMYSTDKGATFSEPIYYPCLEWDDATAVSGPFLSKLPNNRLIFVWHELLPARRYSEIFWSVVENPIEQE